MLWERNNYDTSSRFRSVRFPDLQIFVEKFCTDLQSHYVAAMLVYLQGTPTWRPENSVYCGYLGH